MKDAKELLKIRKKLKNKKPKFRRQDSHKRKKLEKKWRRPKGLQSKMRLNKRGYSLSVSKGYSSPKKVKGLDKSGLRIIIINSLNSLESINPEKEGVLIASNVGLKKRITIIAAAKEKGIRILNVKDAEEWLNASKQKIEKRRRDKKKKLEKKEEKKKQAKKTKKKKEELAEKLSDEEKKQKEKKEKDKVLIKKNG